MSARVCGSGTPVCGSGTAPNRNVTSPNRGRDVIPVSENVKTTGPTSSGFVEASLKPPLPVAL